MDLKSLAVDPFYTFLNLKSFYREVSHQIHFLFFLSLLPRLKLKCDLGMKAFYFIIKDIVGTIYLFGI